MADSGRDPRPAVTIVSIITPAYNAGPWIGAAVQSVLDQTHDDWQMTIINDGSTDNTADVLAGFDDPRITVIHQANAGVSAARNLGLDQVTGDYVTFLDADDFLPADSLALRVAFLEANPQVDIVDGAVSFCTPDLATQVRLYQPRPQTGPFFEPLARLDGSVFAGVIYMLRRSSLGDLRLQTGLSHAEDLMFYLHFAKGGAIYGSVPEVTYQVRVVAGSAMSDLDGLGRGYRATLGALSGPLGASAPVLREAKQRVARIMVLSWLRKGALHRALSSLWWIWRS